MAITAIRGFVSGLVQGVGFRQASQKKARSLEISGWVKNLENGGVEFYAEGTKESLDLFCNWLKLGPQGAIVKNIKLYSVPLTKRWTDFFIN